MAMENINGGRYAVYALGDGGVILVERVHAGLPAARADLDRTARTCKDAHRVILLDRQDGRRIAEQAGPAASARKT